jgi:S-adenosylmethionine decarboxylase
MSLQSGCEWIIEAHACDARRLADLKRLEALFARLIAELDLHPIAPTSWHQFPSTGGVTGLSLLRESHIACHTFPEYSSLCLNVFCCRPRPDFDFAACLAEELGAGSVQVRKLDRPYHT